MMELLKQKRYAALDVADQVINVFAAKEDYLDDLKMEDVVPFRDGLAQYMQHRYPELRDEIRVGKINDELSDKLKAAIEEFKVSFVGDDADDQA